MAFTAVHYPVDKDQNHLPFWADNEELGGTGDNFFDQFVTFDAGDAAAFTGEVLEDPPSPSLLLDSLQNELINSYSHHSDWPLDSSGAEEADTAPPQAIATASETDSTDQASHDPAILTALAADPVLSNGSISDSELLRLEGISLKSPRENATEPPSPIVAQPASASPRKHNRFVETIYATIRRAAHRSKSPKKDRSQPTNMTHVDPFMSDPRSTLNVFDIKFEDPGVAVKTEPMKCDRLPLSPPLTGRIANEHQGSISGFVSGHLDDPFSENALGASTVIHPAECQGINTPETTPAINSEIFFPSEVMLPVNASMSSYRHPQRVHRSTNSAEWPMEGLLTSPKFTEDANLWDNGTMSNQTWWDVHQENGIPRAEPTHLHITNGSSIHGNVAHNMVMHNQQADLPYEYNAELSGLMIHMPRPRAPPASVLSTSLNEHVLANPTMSSSSYPLTNTPSLAHAHHYSNKGHGHTERRPRPRAPSSGARHHGAQTSPRKLHHSHSLGYLREQSISPSPMGRHGHPLAHTQLHHHSSHQERRQQRSSSLTMRKQRSFTRREPRTPGGSTPGSSGGGAGGFVDFVNYTPSDGNVLMTGVAPSGSSKTKARREKEAMEKSRRISEAALKAVQEYGGDVKKFMGDLSLDLDT
ncbi:hypothetical protein GGS21DRAFT_330993 [Xylaria nigripes]|nr:hypothetical protein GGS21DRAFT_330993 [Xylaria nigripes]